MILAPADVERALWPPSEGGIPTEVRNVLAVRRASGLVAEQHRSLILREYRRANRQELRASSFPSVVNAVERIAARRPCDGCTRPEFFNHRPGCERRGRP